MNKTTKIIVSVAVAVVIAAGIVTVSLLKESAPTTQQTSFSIPNTTQIVKPGETEQFFDWDDFVGSLDLSTEPESSTLNPSDTTTTLPVSQNIIISYVYADPTTTTQPTTEPTTKQNVVQMVDYKYDVNDDSVTIKSYFGSDMSPRIPDKINGLPVTTIADNCFKNMPITSVYVPNTVHYIGIGAFSGCTKLKAVYFMGNDSSLDIGPSAFQNCKALTTINLPTQTLSIGNNAFSGCSALMKLSIPETVTEIGPSAFAGTNENFTIHCKMNSEAHAVAVQYNIKFEVE